MLSQRACVSSPLQHDVQISTGSSRAEVLLSRPDFELMLLPVLILLTNSANESARFTVLQWAAHAGEPISTSACPPDASTSYGSGQQQMPLAWLLQPVAIRDGSSAELFYPVEVLLGACAPGTLPSYCNALCRALTYNCWQIATSACHDYDVQCGRMV